MKYKLTVTVEIEAETPQEAVASLYETLTDKYGPMEYLEPVRKH